MPPGKISTGNRARTTNIERCWNCLKRVKVHRRSKCCERISSRPEGRLRTACRATPAIQSRSTGSLGDSAAALSKPTAARSRLSTNASMERTGFSGPIWSSTAPGRSSGCARSVPERRALTGTHPVRSPSGIAGSVLGRNVADTGISLPVGSPSVLEIFKGEVERECR